MRWKHSLAALITAVTAPWALLAGSGAARAQAAAEEASVIIAAQIRAQGYPCNKPGAAARDADLSRPDRQVWVVRCEDASYRVRLAPGMASHVERLNE